MAFFRGHSLPTQLVGNAVEWAGLPVMARLNVSCCVFGKDTLRQFPLLDSRFVVEMRCARGAGNSEASLLARCSILNSKGFSVARG